MVGGEGCWRGGAALRSDSFKEVTVQVDFFEEATTRTHSEEELNVL